MSRKKFGSKNKAKTPSANSDSIEAIITGLMPINVELDDKSALKIESILTSVFMPNELYANFNKINDFLETSSNMLIAIAGLLYNETSINPKTNADSLLSKVSGKTPIFSDNDDIDDKDSAVADIKIAIEGLEGNSLMAMSALIDSIRDFKDVDDSVLIPLETLNSAFEILEVALGNIKKFNKKNKINQNDINQFQLFSQYTDNVVDMINMIGAKYVKTQSVIGLTKKMSVDPFTFITAVIGGKKSAQSFGLIGVMDAINEAESKGVDLKQIVDFFTDFDNVMKIVSASVKYSIVINTFGNMLVKSISVILNIIEAVNSAKSKSIKRSISSMEQYVDLIDSLRSIYINLSLVAVFAVPAMLGALLLKTSISFISSSIEDINIIVQGTIKKKNFQTVKDFTRMIFIIGMMMVVPALVGGFFLKNWDKVLGFAGLVVLFTSIIVVPLLLISSLFSGTKMIKGLNSFTSIIIVCSGVLMIGALFMLSGLWKESLAFGALITTFVTLITLAFAIYGLGGRKTLADASSFNKLIIICAGILIIGSLFMLSGLWIESLKFAGMVVAFVFAISLIFMFAGRKMSIIRNAAWGIMGIVIVSTLVLLIGAHFMQDKEFAESAMNFAFLLIGFVAAIGFMAWLLANKLGNNIVKGLLIMLAIVGISILATKILKNIAEAVSIFGDNPGKKAFTMVAVIATIIVGIALIVGVLGLLATVGTGGIGAMVFAAGLAVVGGIVAIAMGISEVMLNIANAFAIMQQTAKNSSEKDAERITELITSFKGVCKDVAEASKGINLNRVKKTADSMMSVAQMISTVANAMKDISDLKIATKWDRNGNPIEWREIGESDFTMAATQTAKIMTALSNAVISVYDSASDKSIFEPTGWFKNKDSKFCQVVTSMKSLTDFIGTGIQIIKDIADLSFEYTDENGKVKRVSITDADLSENGKLQKSISLVMTCLSNAIAASYEANKGTIFNKNWAPIKTFKKHGDTINDIFGTVTDTIENVVNIAKSVENTDTVNQKWNSLITGIFSISVTDAQINNMSKLFSALKEENIDGPTQLIKSINKLDTNKSDKFIELIQKMADLSQNMEKINTYAQDISNKINSVLDNFGNKMEYAANAIKESDKIQEKRQQKIDENTNKIKELFKTPMNVNISGGNVQTVQQSSDNTAKSQSEIETLKNEIRTIMNNNDNTLLANISGNTSDILMLLQAFLDK